MRLMLHSGGSGARKVLPILRKVRESGLDYAAMTAALESAP